MTDAEFNQQQLEQQQMLTKEHLDLIAYRCLGVAQSLKDCRDIGITGQLTHIENRLIELVKDYELLRGFKND